MNHDLFLRIMLIALSFFHKTFLETVSKLLRLGHLLISFFFFFFGWVIVYCGDRTPALMVTRRTGYH